MYQPGSSRHPSRDLDSHHTFIGVGPNNAPYHFVRRIYPMDRHHHVRNALTNSYHTPNLSNGSISSCAQCTYNSTSYAEFIQWIAIIMCAMHLQFHIVRRIYPMDRHHHVRNALTISYTPNLSISFKSPYAQLHYKFCKITFHHVRTLTLTGALNNHLLHW